MSFSPEPFRSSGPRRTALSHCPRTAAAIVTGPGFSQQSHDKGRTIYYSSKSEGRAQASVSGYLSKGSFISVNSGIVGRSGVGTTVASDRDVRPTLDREHKRAAGRSCRQRRRNRRRFRPANGPPQDCEVNVTPSPRCFPRARFFSTRPRTGKRASNAAFSNRPFGSPRH